MKTNEIKLELVKEAKFLGTACNLYKDKDNNVYMTREQVGQALEYSEGDGAIRVIHNRNKERLDKFSTSVKLKRVEGKREVYRDMVLYSERGIYDICRFSKQPVANDFFDWVYEQVETIRKTGGVIDNKDLFIQTYCEGMNEAQKTFVKGFMTKIEENQEEIKEKDKRLEVIEPMAESWSAFMDAKGNLTMNNVAKALNIKGIGRNKLFEILRNAKVLRSTNEPYQRFINSEYFEVITGEKNGRRYCQTVVTGKGMEYINKNIGNWIA